MDTDSKNKLFKWAWYATIIFTIFLGVQTLTAVREWRNVDPAFNSLSVSGEGEVVAVPDVATFSFTVSADAKTVADAQKSVNDKMNTILSALKGMGIEDKDIKTSDYSVWPKYVYQEIYCVTAPCPGGRQVPDGYTANHSVSVKVRKTEDAGKALGLAGDNGATNISGINFSVDDPAQVFEEARALAIEDAREKAEALADNLDVRLVRIVNFYDNSQNPPMPYGYGGDMAVKNQAVEARAGAPVIPQGENKVKVSVTVTYEIR